MASKKLLAVSEGEKDDARMDMSPMIDMVFLLLIFFMVASTLIVNRLDPYVKPPIADKAVPAEQAIGRIVINVYSQESIEERQKNDPSYVGAKFTNEMGEPLEDEDAITTFVSERVEEIKLAHPEITPRILLRGDRRSQVIEAKRVAKASGAAGVIDIIFSSYQIDKGF